MRLWAQKSEVREGVYQKAYELAMKILEMIKKFPPEERFALTGQIRRSSVLSCPNLREAWANADMKHTT